MNYDEVDIPSSYLLIEENYPVIQLAYCYCRLLIGTTERCLFFNPASNNEIQQIGKQNRKSLGKYGITFFPTCLNYDYVIYSARPNLHLWKCGSDGNVIETVILKELMKKNVPFIQIQKSQHTLPPNNVQLSLLKLYCDRYLISWNETSLLIIDPIEKKIIGCCWNFDNIIDLTTCKDEIFLLLRDRNLIRIANYPENVEVNIDIQEESLIASIKTPFKQFEDSWKKLSVFPIRKEKFFLQSNQLFQWHPKSKNFPRNVAESIKSIESTEAINEKYDRKFNMDENDKLQNEMISSAENIYETGNENSSLKTDKINEESDLKSLPINESSSCVKTQDVNIKDKFLENIQNNQITSTEKTDENLNNTDKLSNESNNSDQSNSQDKKNLDLVNNREPLSLEEILFRYKNYHKENRDRSDLCETSDISNSNITDNISTEKENEIKDKSLNINKANNCLSFTETGEIITQEENENKNQEQLTSMNEEISINTDFKSNLELKIENCEFNRKIQNFENNSCIKKFDEESKHCNNSDSVEMLHLSDNKKDLKSNVVTNRILLDYKDIWIQDKTPDLLVSLAACNQYLYCIDINRKVWYSSLSQFSFSWVKTTKEANQIAVPLNGNVVSVLNKGTAYIALFSPKERNLSSANWRIVAENISYIAIDDSSIWYINNNGELYVQQYALLYQSNFKSTHISCEYHLAEVTSQSGNVCVLTTTGKILYRTGITVYKTEGSGWKEIRLMENMIVKTCALGCKDLLWIIDNHCKVWFHPNISKVVTSETNCKWWQIDMSDLLFQDNNQMRMIKDLASSSMLCMLSSSNIPWNGKTSNLHSYITTNEKGVWYYELPSKTIFSNRKEIIGHHWKKIPLGTTEISYNLKYISAESSTSEKGGIWGLLKNNDILHFSNETEKPLILKPPDLRDKISCLTSAPEALWILTSLGKIFIINEIFCTNLEEINWKKLDLSQLANIHLVHITCGKNTVWACDNEGICYFRAGPLTLSSVRTLNQAWIPVDLNAEHEMKAFVQVYILNIYFYLSGGIWGLLKNNDILHFSNETEKPLILKPPDLRDKISCLTSAPEALWILTSLGKIFIINEIFCTNLEEINWKKLDLSQLANIHLVHITCGKNTVWACDNEGICYFRAGPLTLSSVRTLNQAWIPVDLNAEHEMKAFVQGNSYHQTRTTSHSVKQICITKIYAGQNYFMIWAIDKKHNIYVREGIFLDLPIGTGWVYVKGIQAKQLCITNNFVYAVTLNDSIYCRIGITDKNYIGDYWKKIPGSAVSLSANSDGRLYAIGLDEALYQHEMHVIKQSSSAKFKSVSTVVEKVQEEDWEFI
ncbi:tectonin beta-propeller repeat-containing protein 2-like [Centruroides sculpturatus]|uniref:tectonin beta-propeller repeat-containing protein 2-like n=1 Tax=Centruroides sculpturatus TaxID=218467 RepID=UPI000C6D07BB|nr:tectonin beta-propeller repeat-containing protein 2-like [Centruroides sculpturatus]